MFTFGKIVGQHNGNLGMKIFPLSKYEFPNNFFGNKLIILQKVENKESLKVLNDITTNLKESIKNYPFL